MLLLSDEQSQGTNRQSHVFGGVLELVGFPATVPLTRRETRLVFELGTQLIHIYAHLSRPRVRHLAPRHLAPRHLALVESNFTLPQSAQVGGERDTRDAQATLATTDRWEPAPFDELVDAVGAHVELGGYLRNREVGALHDTSLAQAVRFVHLVLFVARCEIAPEEELLDLEHPPLGSGQSQNLLANLVRLPKGVAVDLQLARLGAVHVEPLGILGPSAAELRVPRASVQVAILSLQPQAVRVRPLHPQLVDIEHRGHLAVESGTASP